MQPVRPGDRAGGLGLCRNRRGVRGARCRQRLGTAAALHRPGARHVRRRRAARLLAGGSCPSQGCPAAVSLSAMLFTAATLRGLSEGRVSCTYRRWEVVRPKLGSRFTTSAGVVEVTSITPADEEQLTERDAAAAGFDSVAALLKWCSGKGRGDLYRIGIVLAGPDPRVLLRSADL